MSATPDVRVGQVWADNDKRSAGRHVKVIAIEPARGGAAGDRRPVPGRAQVALCRGDGTLIRTGQFDNLTVTRIKLDRFRPTSNGYRLVIDV